MKERESKRCYISVEWRWRWHSANARLIVSRDILHHLPSYTIAAHSHALPLEQTLMHKLPDTGIKISYESQPVALNFRPIHRLATQGWIGIALHEHQAAFKLRKHAATAKCAADWHFLCVREALQIYICCYVDLCRVLNLYITISESPGGRVSFATQRFAWPLHYQAPFTVQRGEKNGRLDLMREDGV